MALRRHIRERECDGKVQYTEYAAAMRAVRRLRREGDTSIGRYWCRFCHFWHLGHSSAEMVRMRVSA
jgi:hypothetical protein